MAKWTDAEIADVLTQDGLANAERITGKSYKDDRDTMGLGFLLHSQNVKARQLMLEQSGDTTYSMKVGPYTDVVRRIGFEQVLSLPFVDQKYGDIRETFHVWFRRDGCLLAFDTFGVESVNGGKVYYNWRPNSIDDFRHGITSSGCMDDSGVWCGYHDCRQALAFNLRRLSEHGSFVSPWVKQPFLWLLHHADTNCEGYEFREINRGRIEMLPEHVRECIGPA